MFVNRHLFMRKAKEGDIKKWFHFTWEVQDDFCGMDLVNNESHRNGVMKNIRRATTFIVEDLSKEGHPIIGAVMYSTNQAHISWLAVHRDYRRLGIARQMMVEVFQALSEKPIIKVMTFRDDDEYGFAARHFYKSMGFEPGEIILHVDNFPHPVQVFTKE